MEVEDDSATVARNYQTTWCHILIFCWPCISV